MIKTAADSPSPKGEGWGEGEGRVGRTKRSDCKQSNKFLIHQPAKGRGGSWEFKMARTFRRVALFKLSAIGLRFFPPFQVLVVKASKVTRAGLEPEPEGRSIKYRDPTRIAYRTGSGECNCCRV